MLEILMLHQMPERPRGVFVRIRSKGIRIHVSRMLSLEGGKVLPRPPKAPAVVISAHIKSCEKPMMRR